MRILRVPRRKERGSAAVLGSVFIGVLAVVALLVGAVGGVVVDQRRVASAADLAALAGAAALQSGGHACGTARSVARRNGASVTRCRVRGAVITIVASRTPRSVLGRTVRMSAEARAGPVDSR